MSFWLFGVSLKRSDPVSPVVSMLVFEGFKDFAKCLSMTPRNRSTLNLCFSEDKGTSQSLSPKDSSLSNV